MKKILLFVLAIGICSQLFSQETEIKTDELATVYFVRANAMGGLINFTYFDGEQVIGRFNGPKYMVYKCKPGEHLFWARSENKSFVEANLEAGKTYLIDVVPKMGGLKASVKLVPVDVNDYKMKRIQKIVTKKDSEMFTEEELASLQEEMTEIIARGMEKYKDFKEKDKEILQLSPTMTITEEDLIFVKKNKKSKNN